MGEVLIKPYEISIWEDELVTENGNSFYKEKKIAIIGSTNMTARNRIYDIVFTHKDNGEKELTFSLRYIYFDPEVEADVVNPFASFLINERKIKLFYDNQWYDFIIKEHTESSDGAEWRFTATDAFVLELSKNGYNVEFDAELNNNQGTARELAEKTLENTDWTVAEANIGKQKIVDPLYKAALVSSSVQILNTDTNEKVTLEEGVDIYVFYNYVANKQGNYVQFMLRTETPEVVDDKNNIIATNYRILDELKFEDNAFTLSNGEVIISLGEIETKYQGYRLVYAPLTTYDPVMKRTVDIYQGAASTVYHYLDYTYTTSTVLTNYITNGGDFDTRTNGTLQGWEAYNTYTGTLPTVKGVTYPYVDSSEPLAQLNTFGEIEGYLQVKFGNALDGNYRNTVFNSGIEDNATFVDSIAKGQKYVLRLRAGQGTSDKPTNLANTDKLGVIVAKYTKSAPDASGYSWRTIDSNNIILRFDNITTEANTIIDGGTLTGSTSYVIDGVVQEPSTKCLYKYNNVLYAWNSKNQEYQVKPANYINYYYGVATAAVGVSNTEIHDINTQIGIFLYTKNASNYYYIQDIQLTKYVEDKNGEPLTIGNIPTATSNATDFFYVRPETGTAAEDVHTYKSLEALEEDLGVSSNTFKPVYNKNSEKVLSISESHSNCFNILQSIAETFECWVDLQVQHDENGAISLDENGNPTKLVYLKEYAGKDNFAGFKYGINLDSIERTINSDEIVTKLIVEQTQSDYVDAGAVSIQSAPSNVSGESYILNFDYYYSQGLITNREEAQQDVLHFNEQVKAKNTELEAKQKERNSLELALISLNSKRNVYSELIDTAKDMVNEGLDQFKELTGGISYAEYQRNHTTIEKITDKLTESDTFFDIIGQLYANSSVINNYSGLLTNVDKEYKRLTKELKGNIVYVMSVTRALDDNDEWHVQISVNDYVTPLTFRIGQNEYHTTVSTKYFDVITDDTNLTITQVPQGYEAEQTTITIDEDTIQRIKIKPLIADGGLEEEIKLLIEEKQELTNNFYAKYSRFIQEGTWSANDYIDSELYYLDAIQVSNTSAQPQVEYSIKVVEVSELDGLQDYSFEVGDKTYIEDTKFFGWSLANGLRTPAREEVIVSEVEWHLDDPSQNVITIQNYKTQFEDLFQRINATVQTVQYNEAAYAKITSVLDADGTINQDLLLASLSNIAGRQYNLTSDGSVLINGDSILIRNLTNSANLVKINSEGIRISSDGGITWATAINGRGINIGEVYAGSIDTDRIYIGGHDNPSFRWDKAGISAYRNDGEHYDLKTFVRYDQYGLYGIKNYGTFTAASLQDVKDNAHFAVTWDGFFIKNSYEGGGRVEITSDNDFRVLKTVNNEEKEVIKIGALEWNNSKVPVPGVEPTLYGIRITNDLGVETFKTGNDGNITVTGTINANAGDFSGLVTVGKDSNDNSKPYIIIDGRNNQDATISSSKYSQDGASYGWMINADGDAVFNNITARGAIKTAVFEYAEIQAVGGVFIFRPSSTIRSAAISGNDLVLTVEKPILFKDGQWCKVSNYASGSNTSGGEATDPDIRIITNNNGLTHIYQVARTQDSNEITLVGAKAMVEGAGAVVDSVDNLIGGALVDMGNKAGTSNYGIGINSSDNTVNLPARAISLFETVVDETREPKVTYKYRGILGTLPRMGTDEVSSLYTSYLEGKQGIFTNNMYIGDKNQYMAFYTDEHGHTQLRIVAKKFEILPDDSDLDPIDLGDSIVDQKIQYAVSTSDEEYTPTTPEKGWSIIQYEIGEGEYLWQRTYIKYASGRIEYLPSETGSYMPSGAGQQGPPGPVGPSGADGEDAVLLNIDSSNGNTFKNNSVNTVLTVTIFKGATIISNVAQLQQAFGNTAYLQWYWKRQGDSTFRELLSTDSMLSNGGFTLTLTPDKVDVKVVFQCEIKTVDN